MQFLEVRSKYPMHIFYLYRQMLMWYHILLMDGRKLCLPSPNFDHIPANPNTTTAKIALSMYISQCNFILAMSYIQFHESLQYHSVHDRKVKFLLSFQCQVKRSSINYFMAMQCLSCKTNLFYYHCLHKTFHCVSQFLSQFVR